MTTPLPLVAERIEDARPLPARFYRDAGLFESTREAFARSWQWLGPPADDGPRAEPSVLLPGFLDEPLLATRDESGRRRLFPNVCTHRAHPVATAPGDAKTLVCGYHGRRFGLDGRCLGAPGFERVPGFPCAEHDLAPLAERTLAGHRFVRLLGADGPAFLPGGLERRVQLDALTRALPAPRLARDFEVAAHWALYVENYLEGFHVPFVHPSLHRELDPTGYTAEPFEGGVLQVGRARTLADAFDADSTIVGPAEAERASIAAYYLWWFPNTMWNVYPWGLSVNVVEPLDLDRTRVRFRAFVLNEKRLASGAGADLDRVEAEDEAVVERVQQGVRSRHWHGTNFAPTHERGVHQFHRLLAAALTDVLDAARA
ncbi:MAG: SRPBCC family protein [Planctomycetota bacterium]